MIMIKNKSYLLESIPVNVVCKKITIRLGDPTKMSEEGVFIPKIASRVTQSESGSTYASKMPTGVMSLFSSRCTEDATDEVSLIVVRVRRRRLRASRFGFFE
jgi:hypothetical protein